MLQVLKRLEALEQAGGLVEVAVVGAGYAGIELAATVAERLGAKGNVKVITASEYPESLKLCWPLMVN